MTDTKTKLDIDDITFASAAGGEVATAAAGAGISDPEAAPRPAPSRGRLINGLDATASRAETWVIARDLQARIFREAADAGGNLEVQLAWYRARKRAFTKWYTSAEPIITTMNKIECEGGMTQICWLLEHVLQEHAHAAIRALTFVGDCFEEERSTLDGLAARLSEAGIPAYVWHEGNDPTARAAFQYLALRTGGEYFVFKPSRIERFAQQLIAVATAVAIGTDAEPLLCLTDERE